MAEQDIEVGEIDHKQKLLDDAKKLEQGRGESEEREELPEVAVEDEGDEERDDQQEKDRELLDHLSPRALSISSASR